MFREMLTTISLTLLLLIVADNQVYGLSCYKCSVNSYESAYASTIPCYSAASTLTSFSCSGTQKCISSFIFNDGILFSVIRGCTSTTTTGESCNTTLTTAVAGFVGFRPTANLQTVDQTTCAYVCDKTNCNTNYADKLKKCSTDCNASTSKGYCDYIIGECVCNAGYTGTNCNTNVPEAAVRKCVQCNSDVDATCSTSTSKTACPTNLRYCSSSQTKQIDRVTGEIQKITIDRGCTGQLLAADECTFSDPEDVNLSEYTEYTCYSTCDQDGCNTNNPNGQIDANENKATYCVQCSAERTDLVSLQSCVNTISSDATMCPTSTGITYCKSEVTYWIKDREDTYTTETTPDYHIQSITRSCVPKAVTKKCTSETIDTFEQVTCQETCSDGGCNTGWPARPKCYKCSTGDGDNLDGYDACLENPQRLLDCTFPYQEYCYIYDNGRTRGGSSIATFSRFIQRGCTHFNYKNGCSSYTSRDKTLYQCNYTCTDDACNVGSGARSLMPYGTFYSTFSLVLVSSILL